MASTKPHILIVDDEMSICYLLSEELTENGYTCDTALDANMALEKIQEQDFDVVLLDIKLPRMSGLDVLKEIKAHCNQTTVIMITCINDFNTMMDALELGAWDYIIKPFDLDEIDSNISMLLENNKSSQERKNYKTPTHLS